MRLVFLLFILFITPLSLKGQNRNSISGGIQLSAISVSSRFESENPYTIKPGAFLAFSIPFSDKITFELMAEYTRTGHRNGTQLYGGLGVSQGESKTIYKDRSLQLALLYSFGTGKIVFRTGLAPQYRTYSWIKLKGSVFGTERNESLKTLGLNIPLQMEYNLGGRANLLLRYERGLLNRLHASNGGSKEFENDFKIGIAYYFK